MSTIRTNGIATYYERRGSGPPVVLYGENERRFIRRRAGILGASLPNAVVKAIPGGGHASNLDNPVFFTHAVRELLEETDQRARGDSAGPGSVQQ